MAQNRKNSYEIPSSLVFLKEEDYSRLSPDSQEFEYLRNEGDHRNPFERDRARIVHSAHFRSLAGKTQVFGPNQSDFFRTRLTHSLEVAQIAKAMTIQICEQYRQSTKRQALTPWEQVHLCDLVEAICLAHDIGQPPFGHTGEDALHQKARDLGGEGFEANAQSLRVLTRLDTAYPGRPGFTRGVLAGVMKYKIKSNEGLPKFIYDQDWKIVKRACPSWQHDITREEFIDDKEFQEAVKKARTFPCQIMDLADEITYAGHDIEDVVFTPLLRHGAIVSITDVLSHIDDEIMRKIQQDVELQSGGSISSDRLPEHWDKLKSRIQDVLQSPSERDFRSAAHLLRREHMNLASSSCTAVKDADKNWTIRISQDAAIRSALIRYVVMPLVYKDSRLVTLQLKGSRIIKRLLEELASNGEDILPVGYREMLTSARNTEERIHVCCDFIAGITEEYSLRLYRRLFESERGVLTDFF